MSVQTPTDPKVKSQIAVIRNYQKWLEHVIAIENSQPSADRVHHRDQMKAKAKAKLQEALDLAVDSLCL